MAELTQAQADEIIKDFSRGFVRGDRELLAGCTTDDFEWHLNVGPDAPFGRVVKGVDGMCAIIAERKANWRDVKYEDVEVRAAGDTILQTFNVSGIDADGKRFNVRAVDLYPVRDGKIARKDTYWKVIQE